MTKPTVDPRQRYQVPDYALGPVSRAASDAAHRMGLARMDVRSAFHAEILRATGRSRIEECSTAEIRKVFESLGKTWFTERLEAALEKVKAECAPRAVRGESRGDLQDEPPAAVQGVLFGSGR